MDLSWFISFRSPDEIWETEPTYLIGEIVHIVLLISCTFSAFSHPSKFRSLVWFSALFGGVLLELLTIFHPQIHNFYHAQATLMLFGKKEPVYMLFGVYIWYIYVPVIVADNILDVGILSKAAYAGLFGGFLFGILDIIGLKYIWWLWHNTEPLYEDRFVGVPIASTFWMSVNIASFSFLLSLIKKYFKKLDNLSMPSICLMGLISGPASSLLVMNIPFMIFYHPIVTYLGYQANIALHVYRIVCLLVIFYSFRNAHMLKIEKSIWVQIFILILSLGAMCFLFPPENVIRTSYGQPFGPCGEIETSFWGAFTREKNVCLGRNIPERDMYNFDCVTGDKLDASSWYTTCGTPFDDQWILYTFFNFVCLFYLLWVLPNTLINSADLKED